jgi:hypothetical protein
MTEIASALQGLWRRSLIAWPDGTRDTTTRVYWLQGLRACADLRQPATRAAPPDLAGVGALHQLSIGHCLWLAQQQGFAGQLIFDGTHYQWLRSIDFQPCAPGADAGSLCWQGEVLVETGRDIGYVEHWHRDSSAPTLPVAAVALRDADENTAAALLRVGPLFMFARDRAQPAAAGCTLHQCVAGSATLQQARAPLDCEISLGSALPSGFRITASTLPWRIGAMLDPQLERGHLWTVDRAPNGATLRRRWQIIEREGEIESACSNSLAGVEQ